MITFSRVRLRDAMVPGSFRCAGRTREWRLPALRPSRSAHRGVSLIARGKKKKGFAELMGGEEEEAVVVKKGAASESDRCPCGGGEDKLPYSRCCKPYHKGCLLYTSPSPRD